MPTLSKPVNPPAHLQQTAEFFSHAEHSMIYGNSFNVHQSTTQYAEKNGFQILQENVATAAFHNSKERFNPPRCHEHTREAVLDEIFEWIIGNVPRETWIAWLNGAAGAGKSAICQSIAERCILHGILVASFFFFRTDSTRNTIDPLIATLAYQIIQLLPETKKNIVEAIESNPLIFKQSFEAQLDTLIVRSLRLLQLSDPALKLLLIIDGVDECNGADTQTNLIHTMAKILRAKNLPFIVLFGSRRENQLVMAFNPRDMKGILMQLRLDDNYHAEEDIIRFLNDSFDKIKETHPFGKRLSTDWPLPDHVEKIVNKASGQFIYASVVIDFLSAPIYNPSIQLEIVCGLRPSGRLTPFSQLDALYCHIFAQVEDILATLNVLAYLIFSYSRRVDVVARFFDYEDANVLSILAPLASVIHCEFIHYEFGLDAYEITFRHASLVDFLCDQGRSGEYCINTFATPLCIRWFKAAEAGRFRDIPYEEQDGTLPYILLHAEVTDELYASLISYTPSQTRAVYGMQNFLMMFLGGISRMDFGDSGKTNNSLFSTILRYVKMEFPREVEIIKNVPIVHEILAQLVAEEEADLSHRQAGTPNTNSASEETMEVSVFDARASPLSMEAPSGVHLSPSVGDVELEEVPEAPTSSQLNNVCQPGGIVSTTVDSHGIVDVIPPSSEAFPQETSLPNKRALVSRIKMWLRKWGRSRT
ncbi:hypothetical protein HYPSUDRAFT_216637, partial [Hypholoma sublateritium FD-334 SS-4]